VHESVAEEFVAEATTLTSATRPPFPPYTHHKPEVMSGWKDY
jgi:hypothetical protein